MMAHVQTQEEWEEEMSARILRHTRDELYLELRFLDLAFSALTPQPDRQVQTFATDGTMLMFSAEQVMRVFRQNPLFLNRAYLHTVLHCIFSHLWIGGSRDPQLWGLACDIAVEYTIDGLEAACTKRILSWQRQQLYERLRQRGEGVSAAVIYRMLREDETGQRRERTDTGTSGFGARDGTDGLREDETGQRRERTDTGTFGSGTRDGTDGQTESSFAKEQPGGLSGGGADGRKKSDEAAAVPSRMALMREFYTDDHRYWPKREDDAAKCQAQTAAQKRWNRIARQTRLARDQRGDRPDAGEELLCASLAAEKGRRSYRDFLKKFAVLREEPHCDPDEFDLNYYTYGLTLYGNLPLIEPLESREVTKIREFVVVIDTSYSTSGELVEGFLRETVDILMQSGSFFDDSVIRVLQCDDQVRSDTRIAGRRELERFLADFRLLGGGGTDFRPAFSYVNELLERGELKNISGLLYFTDGKGIYPGRRPDYKTAFLFLEEYDEEAVPPWAMRLRLEEEELFRERSPAERLPAGDSARRLHAERSGHFMSVQKLKKEETRDE